MTAGDARRERARELSQRLVEAQRPIRILDAVQWDDSVRDRFLADPRELPRVDRPYYESRRPLRFDPAEKHRELAEIERDLDRALGREDDAAAILRRAASEYRTAVDLLQARGTPAFSRLSRDLYGSAGDRFAPGGPTMAALAERLSAALDRIDASDALPGDEPRIPGGRAVEILQLRLDRVFGDGEDRVLVSLDDGIVADAAAGADRIKLRKDASFSERELRLLEVHEGWVHVGTSLNGQRQRGLPSLGKGMPSATLTQEGLAVFMEILGLASYPARVRRLSNRVHALEMAEGSADFLDVYRFFVEQGLAPGDAYTHAHRVFRGSTPRGQPFTKDVSYTKGFVRVYAYLEQEARRGRIERLPLLFAGKVALEDADRIHRLVVAGIVEPPRFLPPQFADPHALTAWLCYSDYLASSGVREACEELTAPGASDGRRVSLGSGS